MPCSATPVGLHAPRRGGAAAPAPARGTTRAPALGLSRLNRRAWQLAVYASWRGLPRRRARLASRCWLGSPGRAWLPAGFHRKVSSYLSPLSQAYLRNPLFFFQGTGNELRPGRRRGCPRRLPQIRTCPFKASGSSADGFAARPLNLRRGRPSTLTLSDGVTVTGNEATTCFPWCPPPAPSAGKALPSTGPSEASSPASAVLRPCATPWAPGAGLGCLRPTLPCVAPVVSLPAAQDARPRAWGT